MGLSGRLPDKIAMYPDPIQGVNYRMSADDLRPGQAALMQNCYWDGGTRIRQGNTALNSTSLGAFVGRGGTKFYRVDGTSQRLIAYNTNISEISDAGVETVLDATRTANQDTHFTTWSITDACYVCNGSNTLGAVSANGTFATTTGTNIPPSPVMVHPMVDRMLCLQSGSVRWTNARVDSVWSAASSTWCVVRPAGSAGGVNVIHPHSLTGQQGDPSTQMLLFQDGAVSTLTGTDFGTDVTASTPSTGFDVALTLIDPTAGCRSPYGVATVPGLGTFWVTPVGNVAWLPFNQLTVKFVGNGLFSRRSDVLGLNNMNQSELDQVAMVYHDQKLKLFIPTSSNAYLSTQYWLDVRPLFEAQLAPGGNTDIVPAWSGPHTGQTFQRVWVENQAGDLDVLRALEGNTANGLYVYTVDADDVFYDTTGATTANIQYVYETFYHGFGAPSWEKLLERIRWDCTGRISSADVTIRDIHGDTVGGLTITNQDGTAITYFLWGSGRAWGIGLWGEGTSSHQAGLTWVAQQVASACLGDRLQVRVAYSANANFVIHSMLPTVKIRRQPLPR